MLLVWFSSNRTFPNFWLRSLSIDSPTAVLSYALSSSCEFISWAYLQKNFLRTSPYLHNCHPRISSTAMLAMSPNLCACCTSKRVIFSNLFQQKFSTKCSFFLRDKLGDTLKSRSSPRQCRRGWGVERELCAGSNRLPQLLYSLVQ